MKDMFFKEVLAFNLQEIIPGDVIQLIKPSNDLGSDEKVYNCIVKKVSNFTITLFIARLKSNSDEFEYEMEEKEYPIDIFHGVGCYKLKHIASKKR